MNPQPSTSFSNQEPQGAQGPQAQLTTLNVMDPARSYDLSYTHQMEQQQSSSGLSLQEQYIPAVIGIIQPVTPIAIIPGNFANSNSYNNYIIMTQPYGIQLPQEQPRLPYPNIPRRILPAVTSDSPNTACIASYSNGHNSGLTSSSIHHLPAALPSQASHLPPGPVPLARPEEQKIHIAPPQMDPAYTCNEPGCGKSYKKPSSLLAHKRWHDEEGSYICDFPNCQMRFTDWQSLSRHRKTHSAKKPFKCDVCKKSFPRYQRLKRHQKLHNPEKAEGRLRFMCQEPGCGKAFKLPLQLRAHIRWHKAHQGLLFCSRPGCKLRFETNSALQNHIKTHTKGKPYTCHTCNEGFTTSQYLGTHMIVHGSLEMACSEPGCGKVFARKSGLKRHMLWHERLRQNVCNLPDCGMAFGTRSHLKQHMSTHTGEKPYTCDICKKRFSRSSTLKTHKQIHIRDGNLETRSTENQGAMHSEATDVPVAEEGGSTEDKELNDGENIN